MYCNAHLLLLRWDTGKVRDRLSGMGWFKDGLRCKGWVNSVIINAITEMNYKHIFFFKYKYNVKHVNNKCFVLNY